jgi:hypothetical protein
VVLVLVIGPKVRGFNHSKLFNLFHNVSKCVLFLVRAVFTCYLLLFENELGAHRSVTIRHCRRFSIYVLRYKMLTQNAELSTIYIQTIFV